MASSYDYNDKLCFRAEWFDYDASYRKNFLLNYYPSDNTLELFDVGLNRLFLKRSTCDGLNMKDIFIGNTVPIYGRQVKITDYADCRTKNLYSVATQHTFAILKPSIFGKIGEIIKIIEDQRFQITQLKMCHLKQNQVIEFYQSDEKDLSLPFLVENLISGPSIALDLVGEDAINRWKSIIGPEDPVEARKTHPDSLRAIYGVEKFSNGFHGSDNHESYVKEAAYFFKDSFNTNLEVNRNNATCCVIKPHAIRDRNLGLILTELMKHFKITAMQMFYLSKPNANEFLEIYHEVVKDFGALVASYIEGPCVAIQIEGKNGEANIHGEWRRFVGPRDPDVARQIRPYTLRAKFGRDLYRNAVHCTDLEEDTDLELEYFFKILS